MPIPSTFLIDFDAFVEAYKKNACGYYWIGGLGQDEHYSAICLHLESIRTSLVSSPKDSDVDSIIYTLGLTSDLHFTTDPLFKTSFMKFLQTYNKKEPSNFILDLNNAPYDVTNNPKVSKFDMIHKLQKAAEDIQKNFQQILDSTADMIMSLNATIKDLTLDNIRLKNALPNQMIEDIPTGPPPAAPPPPPAFSLPKTLRFFRTGTKASTPETPNKTSFVVTDSDLSSVKLKKVTETPQKQETKTENQIILDIINTAMQARRQFIS